MATAFPLQTVLDYAARKLEVSGAELQKLRTRWQQAQDKLDELRGYRTEYEAGLAAALAKGLEADRLRDYQAFLGKLARAIEAQSAEVEHCKHAWEEARASWLRLRSREQALQVLRERHAQREARGETRAEQKQQDEFALKAMRERPLGSSEG
jgi:flagellar FliJ protein